MLNRIYRKWCQRLQVRTSPPHALGARMTVVAQIPSNELNLHIPIWPFFDILAWKPSLKYCIFAQAVEIVTLLFQKTNITTCFSRIFVICSNAFPLFETNIHFAGVSAQTNLNSNQEFFSHEMHEFKSAPRPHRAKHNHAWRALLNSCIS